VTSLNKISEMKPTLLHSTAIIFALLFFFLMSNAQSFHLVKDLNSGLADGSPKFLSSYNGKLYFDGFSPASGQGIFVSDGTDAGTVFLAEGQLGGYSELGFGCGLNGKFYFALGGELWVSDGTLAGTRNVKNINPINPDDPMYFTPHNNKIYFSATDGDYNYEMWSTDGTTLGTTQVKDIHPSDGSYPRYFCSYNNNLLFAANNGIFGYQLWKTDISGMTDTVCIHSDGIGSPEQLTVFNNKVYYYSVPPGMLGALCVTDGTLQGTRFVKKINPFDDDYIDNIIAFNGRLFFTATDTVGTELWTSDGSEM
jgi:ELWxxDGT repeat protein